MPQRLTPHISVLIIIMEHVFKPVHRSAVQTNKALREGTLSTHLVSHNGRKCVSGITESKAFWKYFGKSDACANYSIVCTTSGSTLVAS